MKTVFAFLLLLAFAANFDTGCSSSRPEAREHLIHVYFVNDSREALDLRNVTGPVPPVILYPIERRVVAVSPERAALDQLLAGPRADEVAQGYSSNLASVRLREFRISRDTAYVDLEGEIQPGVLAAPRLRAQVERTMRELPTIRVVELLINNRKDFDSLR